MRKSKKIIEPFDKAQGRPRIESSRNQESGAFTTEATEVTEAKEKHSEIVSQISFLCLFLHALCASVVSLPRLFTHRSNTSDRTKKAHAFAPVEDVTLCPSQD